MRGSVRFPALVVVLAAVLGAGCGRGSGGPSKPAAPVVREDSKDLALFWFDSTGAVHRVESVGEVPLEARDRVLVQPLDARQSSGAWAFVADLRKPGGDGKYPVQVVTREAYSEEVRARMRASHPEQEPAATASAVAGSPPGPAPLAETKQVVIYLTQGCPHCRRAKQWMTQAGVPFIEHDLEEDRDAARWVLDHTGSTAVPVFQVGKRVIQGFDQGALRRAIEEELGLQLL
ncbi:MAG: glutaredoxin family protein [Deltaproteobacteria bacterium]|nr:glutaredoxin family protein [Deltaproteobacteria bacterium]